MFKNKKGVLFVRLLLVFFPCIEGASRLNEYIHHYETLDYDPAAVHEKHLRVKRWATGDGWGAEEEPEVHINFKSHQRDFRLRLRRDTTSFSPNLHLEGDGAGQEREFSHIYAGHVDGVAQSHAFGSIRDGVFDGKIITPEETFYVERSHKYTLPSTNESLHSVIYTDREVHDPYHHHRTGHAKGCGITDEVMEWMSEIQNSAVDGGMPELKHPKSKPFQKMVGLPVADRLISNDIFYLDQDDHSYSMYSREANLKFNNNTGGGGEILSLIAQHVKAVNHIYSNTLFDGKETYKNIRFEVQRIKIDTDKVCRPEYRGSEKNLFCMENIDVSNFLNLHSLSDHEIFCLAYVFTYRDFTGGTLGLAWVASASGASGGVCEKYKTYTETIGGVYQSTKRSLNTGIITFVNYNSRVPPKVSQLTLAHEIGHNFGSPHDYPNKCRPGGTDGNFIMFASATSGDRPNNSKFSECSVRNISSVLDAIIHDSKKHNCFIATNGTFCGNKIVEEGEECDCGFTYEECEEQCCYPRQISEKDRMQNPDAQGCKRKPLFRCSPSEGPCCDQSCHFVQQTRVLCKQETECSYTSYCNGTTAQCPVPKPRPNLTPCNDGTQVCQGGECRGSICLKYDLEECFLSSSDKNADKRKLCELACLDKMGRCRSTSELNLDGLPDGLSLRPGAPCDNFQGYCDVFLKCRAVDAEGPLARLKNLLFNKETLLNVAQWVTENWYYVLLMGVGFIIIMGMFIKCCAVHTPSSNPKKAPHIRIGDTLRRPISTLRRHRHAQYRAANSNIPNVPNGAAASSQQSQQTPSGAPPPYSAIAGPSAPRGGLPPHGFGEGRGPNRNRGGGRPQQSGNPYAGAYHKDSSRHQQHRV
ncbi:Disintegrin and metalloproteinase domain-containing protein 10 [Folsomia candida]|uniref:ADAM10 endopeptidase n=1 Tax=Folsomia candida TaxID=158441 RepID=A0A226EET5_FOLCA|nr:Disintegrin and metalloproteinase domain-containing protein 10 [Folsomia candida]